MNLDRVTITGADNSVMPGDLLLLSKKFPFVEWGILVSRSQEGNPRYPSQGWINALQDAAYEAAVQGWLPQNPRLSLHVCGSWVREWLLGKTTMPESYLRGFDRIQLNFHAERTPCEAQPFAESLVTFADREFIFQIDGAHGNRHLATVCEKGIENAVAMFDISGGAGILPESWPKPFPELDYHGYAGGLGPDNLAEQLPLIAAAAGEARIWIDMETRVRSNGDAQFDLAKVERCLEIAVPFIRSAA